MSEEYLIVWGVTARSTALLAQGQLIAQNSVLLSLKCSLHSHVIFIQVWFEFNLLTLKMREG